MANVFNVARYILQERGGMATWKLQKLCYYSQAWSLAWTERPLFDEDFEAWSNGPVCPELYQVHKDLLTVSLADIPGDLEAKPELTEEQKDTIDRVLAVYGDWEPHELREQSHSESPWKDARGNLPIGARCSRVVSQNAMGEYFGSL